MQHKILTRNIYIKLAFQHLLSRHCYRREFLVIDIDSFNTFSSLLKVIVKSNPDDEQSVILVKGSGIHSRALSPIAALSYDDQIESIVYCLQKNNFPEWHLIREHFSVMHNWSAMTPKEINIILHIVQCADMTKTARVLNSNIKTVYSRIGVIARKLNVRNANEVRRLAMAEFN